MGKIQEVRVITRNKPPVNGVTEASHKGQLYLDSSTGQLYRARNQRVTDWDEVSFETGATGLSLVATDTPGIYEIR